MVDRLGYISIRCSVQFSRSVMFNSLQPHELEHTRPPCPSPTPGAHANPCPLSRWCHPTISSSVTPSPPAFNLSLHQGLFQWVSSLHQVAKVLEFQLQYQSFQWILRVDFLYDWVYMISFRMSLYAGYIFSGNFPTLLRTFYSHEIIYVTYNSRLEVM